MVFSIESKYYTPILYLSRGPFEIPEKVFFEDVGDRRGEMRKLSTCLPVGRAETSKRSSTKAEGPKIASFSMSAIITHKIYEYPHSKGLESCLSRAAGLFQSSPFHENQS